MLETVGVLIADSLPVYRTGLASILNAEPDITVVGDVADPDELILKCTELKPQVALIEILMSPDQIFRDIAQIRQYSPRTKIIILTNSTLEDHLFQTLEAGAHGYLLKASCGESIIKAVQTIASGQVMLSPDVVKQVANVMRRVKIRPRLSSREAEVLELISDGLTNVEIAAHLYLSESTVRTYIRRLMEKLNLDNRAKLTAFHVRNHHTDYKQVAERLEALQFCDEIPVSQVEVTSTPHVVQPHQQKDSSLRALSERRQVTLLAIDIDVDCNFSGEMAGEMEQEVVRTCLEVIVKEVRQSPRKEEEPNG